MSDEEGGRIFFARGAAPAAPVSLISIGVDIGSATSHFVLSRLVLAPRAGRHVPLSQQVVYESPVLLTPYAEDGTIDARALGAFLNRCYELAGLFPEDVDTGALILTGVAAGRANAVSIGRLFAFETGRFVTVTAGDALETMLAARGSGAVGLSVHEGPVLAIDIGGGTTKLAWCEAGNVTGVTAIDVGARLVCLDRSGAVTRLEPPVLRHAQAAGVHLSLGAVPGEEELARLADTMAARVMDAIAGAPDPAFQRLPPLPPHAPPACAMLSGGVAEYVLGREARNFGDLGRELAAALRTRLRAAGIALRFPDQGIRATVVGAGQHTMQLSGNTIFLSRPDLLPLTDLPVIAPDLPWADPLDADAIVAAIRLELAKNDVATGRPVALFHRWRGTASYRRIAAFAEAVSHALAGRAPLVLVGEGDVGGLIGAHLRDAGLAEDVVSLDGIVLAAFDHCDIGAPIPGNGAVPVVVKSLVFPGQG